MEFRTPVDIPSRPLLDITHADSIVMLGSCFTDNIGAMLERDGFDVVYNPMGPLYNPASIYTAVKLAMQPQCRESELILRRDDADAWHCLNFASRYTDASRPRLVETVCGELDALGKAIAKASYVFFTLGTAFVFSIDERVVGNCHKFPSAVFTRSRMAVDDIICSLKDLLSMLPPDCRAVFTVSPIRHTADGLHGNMLSKASLHLAVDTLVDGKRVLYFPAFEIMLDDLRDYRFYAADMKHPSPVAVDYIYEVFSKYCFSNPTLQHALACRRQWQRDAHRQILK